MITRGRKQPFGKKSSMQCFVAPATCESEFAGVLSAVQDMDDLHDVRCWPCACRVADDRFQVVFEDSNDGGVIGAGWKLLSLLRQWDISNVVIIVVLWDEDSICSSCTPIGEFFRILLNCSKAVLEECFMECISQQSADLKSDESILQQFRKARNCLINPLDFSTLSLMSTCSMADQAPPEVDLNLTITPLFQDDFKQAARTQNRKAKSKTSKSSVITIRVRPASFSCFELEEIQQQQNPPEIVFQVLRCAAVLLGETQSSWKQVKMLLSRRDLKSRMSEFQLSLKTANFLDAWVREYLPTSSAFRKLVKISPVIGAFAEWILRVADCKLQEPCQHVGSNNRILKTTALTFD